MKITIDSAKLTDAPYSSELSDAFLFDDQVILQQLLLELEHSSYGAYLISGYRGSGKTSFINRVSEGLTGTLVIELNVARATPYPVLLKRIIRQLYIGYTTYEAEGL
ncbi:hypothetical protein [Mucilaginibacter phyllosphaerae]